MEIGFIAGVAVLLLGWLFYCRSRKEARVLPKISAAIVEYFRQSGVVPHVECVHLEGKGIVALIEVDPQARFRSSFIIEQTLRETVQRKTSAVLTEVYWRFPMPERYIEASLSAGAHAQAAAGRENSPADDLRYYIGETSWEEYQKAIKSKEPHDD